MQANRQTREYISGAESNFPGGNTGGRSLLSVTALFKEAVVVPFR